ncbi:MAG TPA: adenylate/guanylate cyclase domain-containing protein [Acetobacteraceae bacterium]|nr:adenylate/guanylate cyclase domain-containing protein [Acetobacteraceae bacterium]
MRSVYGKVKPIRIPADLNVAPPGREEAPSRKRKLAAILHADVVGFSRLMGEDEAGTHRALGQLRRAVDPLIAVRGGRIVGTAGDSLLADFTSVVDALNCAVEMQGAARAINDPIPPERRLELRIGVNLGDVIIDGDDIFGDGVNIAARLEALAKPGTVCISQTVYEHVRNKLDFHYRPLGSHRVKNIAEPVRAYAVELAATAPRPRRRRWPLIAATGTAAVVSAGFLVWALNADLGRGLFGLGSVAKPVEVAALAAPARLAGRPSVAVLPFKNLSADTGHDFFSDGITEDVITALGRFSNLLVISKSASFPFKGSTAAPAEIGRLLNARYLLDGSIRRAGNRVRVGVELTEATTGRLVWSETYDAEVDDIFAVQDKIAKRVVGAAAVELTRFEQERILSKPTSNLAAYEYVLRGREAFSHETRDDNDEASELFQRAIDLDPNYADAYAALGGSYYEAVVSGWSEFRTEELERAEALAQKALALDPATTRAYRVLAQVHLYRKRFDLALAQVDRALEINPSDAENYSYRGSILVWAGKAAESLPWLEGALRLDQANGFAAARLCTAYFLLRRYTEAVDVCDRALSRSPGRSNQMVTHPMLAATYAELGRQQDADRERAISARLWPLLDARTFADQFGTQETRDHMLEGLTKAGFH